MQIANLQIGIPYAQTLSSDLYNWFISNTTPLNKCYYNAQKNKFVWTNVEVGEVMGQAKTQTECDNMRLLTLMKIKSIVFSRKINMNNGDINIKKEDKNIITEPTYIQSILNRNLHRCMSRHHHQI